MGCANVAHAFAACPQRQAAHRGRAAPTWASSRPTTTCCRPTSPTRATRR
jgi:hypothetical protein